MRLRSRPDGRPNRAGRGPALVTAEPPTPDPGGSRAGKILLLAGMLGVAANMRPALAEVGPLLSQIRADTHLSGTALALLTALPVICFGTLAPVAPSVARRWGLERALAVAMLALAAGMAIRIGPGAAALFGGTLVLGGAIALTNVLLPAMVKRDFSRRAGLVTGMYTTVLNLSAALAAGSAVPLAAALHGSWRGTFAVWIAPAAVAFGVWIPLIRRVGRPAGTPAPASAARLSLLRNARARQLVTFTAAQSVIYYGVLSWLPSIFQGNGLSATAAGLLLSVTTVISAPVALIVPALAGRRADQRGYVAVIASCAVIGMTGLLVAPVAAPYLWATLIGISQGGAFPLALTFFVLRTRDPAETARLSMAAQSVAYLVAAAGPLAMGILHDQTGSWWPAITLLAALAVVELLAGLGAGRAGYLTPAAPAAPSRETEGNRPGPTAP